MKEKNGFTLIELLAVIAIIGTIALVIYVSLNDSRARARDSRRLSDMNEIQKALEMYFDDNGSYPNFRAQTGNANCGTNWCNLENALIKYLKKLPRDPLGNQNNYRYYYNSDAADNNKTYGLMARMESRVNFPLVASDGGYAGYADINNGQYYELGNQPPYCMSKYAGNGRNWWENTPNVCQGGN